MSLINALRGRWMVSILNCLTCDEELGIHDILYSNIDIHRAKRGQDTGYVYKCENCECYWLDNFMTGDIEEWHY